jgi:CubicO group peptidase (beta-lactamase class C family)
LDVARLESFILSKMSSTRIPGLSIAVVRGGEVVYARGFGFRDVERGLAATPRTVYGIGSVTKSFTAIAVLKLVEEGYAIARRRGI